MVPRRFEEVLVEASPDRLRAAAIAGGSLVDWLDVPRRTPLAAGSIVQGRVTGTAPGLGGVFVDIGAGRPALLDGKGTPEAGTRLLLQIVEPPSDDKGGRVSRRVALAGQHVVVIPGGKGVTASKRLEGKARELVAGLAQAVPGGCGLLLRWTACFADSGTLAEESRRLAERWQTIEAKAATKDPGEPLHDAGNGLLTILRELGAHGTPTFTFNDAPTLRVAQRVADAWFPDMRARLSAGEAALFDRHDVASTIAVASERDVTLPNGGRISVEPTRALTAMDVDSGAGSGVANARLATNLEAAKEIARQLWLRDLGGMIVVDFIRMDEAGERRRVQDALAAAVASDRVPVHLLGWSRAGLFELIRERGRGGGA